AVEGVLGVAVLAAQRTAGQAHEHGRKPGRVRLALQGMEDLGDLKSRHALPAKGPCGPLLRRNALQPVGGLPGRVAAGILLRHLGEGGAGRGVLLLLVLREAELQERTGRLGRVRPFLYDRAESVRRTFIVAGYGVGLAEPVLRAWHE